MMQIKTHPKTGLAYGETVDPRRFRRQFKPHPQNPVKLDPETQTITCPNEKIAEQWIRAGASPAQVKVKK